MVGQAVWLKFAFACLLFLAMQACLGFAQNFAAITLATAMHLAFSLLLLHTIFSAVQISNDANFSVRTGAYGFGITLLLMWLIVGYSLLLARPSVPSLAVLYPIAGLVDLLELIAGTALTVLLSEYASTTRSLVVTFATALFWAFYTFRNVIAAAAADGHSLILNGSRPVIELLLFFCVSLLIFDRGRL